MNWIITYTPAALTYACPRAHLPCIPNCLVALLGAHYARVFHVSVRQGSDAYALLGRIDAVLGAFTVTLVPPRPHPDFPTAYFASVTLPRKDYDGK